jgi:hypothetical protein
MLENTGRRFIGFEIDYEYFKTCCERTAQQLPDAVHGVPQEVHVHGEAVPGGKDVPTQVPNLRTPTVDAAGTGF